MGSLVSAESGQEVAESGQLRAGNASGAKRGKAKETGPQKHGAQKDGAQKDGALKDGALKDGALRDGPKGPLGSGVLEAGEVDPAWQLPEWVMSLTDLADASKRAYENGVRSFVTWVQRAGIRDPGQVTRLLLRRYLAYMATRHYARQTVTQRASALRRYFGWLSRQGVLAGDPTASLSARTGESRLPRVLSRGELGVILDGPPVREEPVGGDRAPDEGMAEAVRLRDDAALELLYGSGLRVSELCGLSVARRGHAGPLGDRVGQGVQATTGANFRERGQRRKALAGRRPPTNGKHRVAGRRPVPQREGPAPRPS